MTATSTEHVAVDPQPAPPPEPPSHGRRKDQGRRWWNRLVPRSRRTRWLTGIGLVLVLALAGWWLLSRGQTTTSAGYRTVTVARGTLTDTVSASGTINAARQADLSFSSGGEVTSVEVEVGDTVKKGAALATIDDSALQIAYTSAKADLTAAKETLADLEDSDASDTAIAAAEATVEVKRNAVAAAKENLEEATLTAPFAGIVATVTIAEGDSVGSGSTGSTGGSGAAASGTASSSSTSSAAITLISKGTFTVSTSVSNSDVGAIKKGLQATVTATGASDPVFGTVTSVGVVASSSSTSGGSATFPVEIRITGTHTDLLAGSSATVAITTAQLTDVISVPTQAITTTDGRTTVTRLVDGREVETTVTIGDVIGSATVITEGLSEGDQVIVSTFRAAQASTTSSNQQGFTGGPPGDMPQGGMPSGAAGGNR